MPLLILVLWGAILTVVLAAVSAMSVEQVLRSFLIGVGAAGLALPWLRGLAFLPGLLYALLISLLREQHAWWAVINHDATWAGVAGAAAWAAAGLTVTALSPHGDGTAL